MSNTQSRFVELNNGNFTHISSKCLSYLRVSLSISSADLLIRLQVIKPSTLLALFLTDLEPFKFLQV